MTLYFRIRGYPLVKQGLESWIKGYGSVQIVLQIRVGLLACQVFSDGCLDVFDDGTVSWLLF